MPLEADSVRAYLFERNMPWIQETRSMGESGAVTVTLRDVEIELDARERSESGALSMQCDALQVRLDSDLARALNASHLSEEWIVWRPGPLRLAIDRSVIQYESAEIPLGDDEAFEVTGTLLPSGYELRGTLEKPFLPSMLAAFEEAGVTIRESRDGVVEILPDGAVIRRLLEGFGR